MFRLMPGLLAPLLAIAVDWSRYPGVARVLAGLAVLAFFLCAFSLIPAIVLKRRLVVEEGFIIDLSYKFAWWGSFKTELFNVEYSYSYRGKSYNGRRITANPLLGTSIFKLSEDSHDLQSGSRVNVYLDPKHPRYAFIDREALDSAVNIMLLFIALAAFSGLVFLMVLVE